MANTVDLIVNVYERTYREVLRPGFFPDLERRNGRAMARRVALINNVRDPADAGSRGQKLIGRGELHAVHAVADHVEAALWAVGLQRLDLGRIPEYSEWAFVALHVTSSEWILYWDPEARLETEVNWVDPAISLMEADPRVLVANPSWSPTGLERETWESAGAFALGYGFSDQVFLARRADLARPIYRERCLASLRYPFAHVAPVFEERLDAYMRAHRRLRATFPAARYEHRAHGRPALRESPRERTRWLWNRLRIEAAQRLPLRDPRRRVLAP